MYWPMWQVDFKFFPALIKLALILLWSYFEPLGPIVNPGISQTKIMHGLYNFHNIVFKDY